MIRTKTNKDSDEFYVIINNNKEFLYHIYEEEGPEFTKDIECAEKFRKNGSGKLSFPKFYRYVGNKKVRSVEQLAEVIGCELVKVESETTSVTKYNIFQ